MENSIDEKIGSVKVLCNHEQIKDRLEHVLIQVTNTASLKIEKAKSSSSMMCRYEALGYSKGVESVCEAIVNNFDEFWKDDE